MNEAVCNTHLTCCWSTLCTYYSFHSTWMHTTDQGLSTSFRSQKRLGDFTQLMFPPCSSLLGWPFQQMPGRALCAFPYAICPCTEPQHPGPPAHHLEKHVDPQLCNPPLQVGRNSCLLVAGHRNTLLKDRGETALTCWPHPLLPWPGHSSVLSSSDSKRTQKLIREPL